MNELCTLAKIYNQNWKGMKGKNWTQFSDPKASVHACFYNIWQGTYCTIIVSDLGGVLTLIK